MYRVSVLCVVFLIVSTSYVSAQSIDGSIPALNCVLNNEKIIGDATTYNPYAAGWKTGGTGLATGGTYNPDSWEAALQLDLAKKYGCGYGTGKTCRAVVSSPSTRRAAILLINDNGPMCADPATYARAPECQKRGRFTRVIDLNKQSMYFLSNGKSGNNVGTLYDVEVAILDPKCNEIGKLGPLTGTDQDAWSKIAANMPATQLPNTAPNTSAGALTPMYGSPYSASPYSPISATPYSSQGAYASYGNAAISPTSATSPTSAGSGGIVQTDAGGLYAGTGSRSASTIIIQPQNSKKGAPIMVSWTSVNMQPFSCKVTKESAEFANGNEATKKDVAPTSGTVAYKLVCTNPAGESAESSASISVQ